MRDPIASCVLQLGIRNRSQLKGILEDLSDAIDGEVLLRKGRITPEDARIELELRVTPDQVQAAMIVLGRPGLAVHSYSILGLDSIPMQPTLSPAAGGLTRPSAASPRPLMPVLVC